LRSNDGTKGNKHPPRFFQVIHLIMTAALILTIIGASESSPSNSPSTLSQSLTLRKVAAILFLVSAVGATGLMLLYAGQFRLVHPGDKIIVICALLAAPFLIVRIIYSILVGFINDATFNFITPNVYVEAFMQALMEFIVFALFATAGLIAPKIKSDEYIGGGPQFSVNLPKRNTFGNGTERGTVQPMERAHHDEAL
jgi:hypothetical protein